MTEVGTIIKTITATMIATTVMVIVTVTMTAAANGIAAKSRVLAPDNQGFGPTAATHRPTLLGVCS